MLVYHPLFSYSFLFWFYQSIGRPLLIEGEEPKFTDIKPLHILTQTNYSKLSV